MITILAKFCTKCCTFNHSVIFVALYCFVVHFLWHEPSNGASATSNTNVDIEK